MAELQRCAWAESSDKMRLYHDTIWGVAEFDDQRLFQKLILDGFQAGLSWSTVLNKMEHISEVFDDFNPEIVANYDVAKIESLLADPGIIRNRSKVESAVHNAQVYLKIQERGQSFSDYLWGFCDHRVIVNRWERDEDVPATTELSDQISKALRREGFKYVGSTIVYAFMQAVGMVDDHILSCHCRQSRQIIE